MKTTQYNLKQHSKVVFDAIALPGNDLIIARGVGQYTGNFMASRVVSSTNEM